jgi:hypothetical protein
MRLAWAIGTTMLVVAGSTMQAMHASSEDMDEEYPTKGIPVKRTDVPPPPNLRSEGGIRTHADLHSGTALVDGGWRVGHG